MHPFSSTRSSSLRLALLPAALLASRHLTHADDTVVELAPYAVRGDSGPFMDVPAVTNQVFITADEIALTNATTAEDTLKYLPNLNIRKRYIGDTNGVTSIRSQNTWMTGRSTVTADGILLSNFLQTRWSGSPRWGAIAAEEIQYSEVTYGPYSPFASGNALSGTIRFITRMPERREVAMSADVFVQDYSLYGTDDTFAGSKLFASWGDAFGPLSLYASWNRLENDSHPQTYGSTTALTTATGAEPEVNGAHTDLDPMGAPRLIYGSTGAEHVVHDQFKLKARYALTPDIRAQFSAVYWINDHDRLAPENYLRGADGEPVWSGTARFGDTRFTITPGDFSLSRRDRDDVLLGLTVGGALGGDWSFDTTLSCYDVLADEERASARNPSDPAYTTAGTVTWFDDTRWLTFDARVGAERLFGHDALALHAGYSATDYALRLNQSASDDWTTGSRDRVSNNTGGASRSHALAVQATARLGSRWRVSGGARQEWWQAFDGFVQNATGTARHPERDDASFSPKLIVDFLPARDWTMSLSLAQATRYPLVPELFQGRVGTDGRVDRNNPDLRPEDALVGELSLTRQTPGGQVRLTAFHEQVDDAIYNLYDIDRRYSLFLNIDEVRTQGLELVFDQRAFLHPRVDLRFNASYTDSVIERNSANPAYEGNQFPRVPYWRIALLGTWRVSEQLALSAGARHQSHSFNRLENDDHGDTYGSVSEFTVVDVRATWRPRPGLTLGLGLDNLFNEEYFVAHSYPQRTVFIDAGLRF